MVLEWKDKQDGVDEILAEDINAIAKAVIEAQKELENLETPDVDLSNYYTKEETDEKFNTEVSVYKNTSPLWQDAPNDETSFWHDGITAVIEGVEVQKNNTISFEVGFNLTADDIYHLPKWGLAKKTPVGEVQPIVGMRETQIQNGVCKGEAIINVDVNKGDILYLTLESETGSGGKYDITQGEIKIEAETSLYEAVTNNNDKVLSLEANIGDVDSALDGIITLQENLIGGGN